MFDTIERTENDARIQYLTFYRCSGIRIREHGYPAERYSKKWR